MIASSAGAGASVRLGSTSPSPKPETAIAVSMLPARSTATGSDPPARDEQQPAGDLEDADRDDRHRGSREPVVAEGRELRAVGGELAHPEDHEDDPGEDGEDAQRAMVTDGMVGPGTAEGERWSWCSSRPVRRRNG